MSGTCHCGCGTRTRVAPKTDRSKDWVKDQPLRYALGHNARVTNRPRRELTADDYSVEDRGYLTPCWIWKGRPTGKKGYCRVGLNGTYVAAHRAFYELLVGQIPDGHDLHHRCEEPSCVRPEHLRPLLRGKHISLHHRKLSDGQITEIRTDDRLLREIAADYGISTTYVSDIRRGRARVAA